MSCFLFCHVVAGNLLTSQEVYGNPTILTLDAAPSDHPGHATHALGSQLLPFCNPAWIKFPSFLSTAAELKRFLGINSIAQSVTSDGDLQRAFTFQTATLVRHLLSAMFSSIQLHMRVVLDLLNQEATREQEKSSMRMSMHVGTLLQAGGSMYNPSFSTGNHGVAASGNTIAAGGVLGSNNFSNASQSLSGTFDSFKDIRNSSLTSASGPSAGVTIGSEGLDDHRAMRTLEEAHADGAVFWHPPKDNLTTDQQRQLQQSRSDLAVSNDHHVGSYQEILLGNRDTKLPLSMASLMECVRLGRAVVKLSRSSGPVARRGTGTGFLISSSVIITNNHIIASEDDAENTSAIFWYDSEAFIPGLLEKRPISVRLLPRELFFTCVDLDYSVVAIATPAGATDFIPLINDDSRIHGDPERRAFSIQHPRGRSKQVALVGVVDELMDEFFFTYTNDTERGSSGSPVFNGQWELIGLHHEWYPLSSKDKSKFKLRGGQTVSEQEFSRQHLSKDDVIRAVNKAVRITAICNHLATSGIQWATAQNQSKLDLLNGVLRYDPDLFIKAHSHQPSAATAAAAEEKAVT
jgi:hypothetical protein